MNRKQRIEEAIRKSCATKNKQCDRVRLIICAPCNSAYIMFHRESIIMHSLVCYYPLTGQPDRRLKKKES